MPAPGDTGCEDRHARYDANGAPKEHSLRSYVCYRSGLRRDTERDQHHCGDKDRRQESRVDRVDDGSPAAEVIATYLHQTHSAGTEQTWPEETAPGDELAKILAIRLVPHREMPPGVVDVRRPVGVEIAFKVLRDGKPVFPKIKVLDREGAIAFNAMDTHERWLRPSPPGDYVSTAWIPGNLLNEGSVIVEAAVCSIDFPKLEHHAAVYEAISFEVLDPGEGDSARGVFAGQWRGVVRPLLEWTTEQA